VYIKFFVVCGLGCQLHGEAQLRSAMITKVCGIGNKAIHGEEDAAYLVASSQCFLMSIACLPPFVIVADKNVTVVTMLETADTRLDMRHFMFCLVHLV
jgi:hypothetical protein